MNIFNNESIKHFHLVGIGGIGVSALAEILLGKGYKVSGSDIVESVNTERLKNLGATIYIGHHADHLTDADILVYTSAVNEHNPEFACAKHNNVPCLQRGDVLAQLLNAEHGIAVSGTHGKTTTSSLLAHVLTACDIDPTYVVGGVLEGTRSPSRVGKSNYFLAEADESDASFLFMHPEIAVITNIDADHLETYQGDFECLKQSFLDFVTNMSPTGVVVACVDDPVVASLIPRFDRPVVTYGFTSEADIVIHDIQLQGMQTQFVLHTAKGSAAVTLNLPGKHNALNAVAAMAVGLLLEIPLRKMSVALQSFSGVGRRFSAHGELPVTQGSALLFEDYGHHPREIAATLQAAHQAWPNARVVLVFQPHRYTRTRDLMDDFVNVLSQADELLLLDVYSAGETPIENADTKTLMQRITLHNNHVPVFVSALDNLAANLQTILQPNDIVLLQGAGSVGLYAKTLRESWSN